VNTFRPVGLMLLTIMPTSAVAWAYRKEGREQPHTHSEQAESFDWSFDQRTSIVSGAIVVLHHWASTVTGGSGSIGT